MDLFAPFNELIPGVLGVEVDAVLFGQLFVHNQCRAGNAGGQAQLLAVIVTIHAQANVVGVKVGKIKVVVLVIQEVIAGGNKTGHRFGVNLHDVGGGAGCQLGCQLIMVAVRRAILGFDLDVGVFFHELVDDFHGGVGALIAAPPGKAQSHLFIAGSGSCGAGRGSAAGAVGCRGCAAGSTAAACG